MSPNHNDPGRQHRPTTPVRSTAGALADTVSRAGRALLAAAVKMMTWARHPIKHFRRRLEEFGAYPSGVVPVPAYLPGTAFFAASAGLYRRAGSHLLPPFPFGGWMFVGHNLDAEGPFRRRLESGHSHGDPARPMRTWQNLYKLLAKAGVDPRECFFTNAYVGLKEGDDPTGRFPGSGDAAFRQWCAEFLMDQLAVMRPRVVATLGVDAARFLASVIPDLRDRDRPRLPQPRPRAAVLHSHHFGVVALVTLPPTMSHFIGEAMGRR